MNGTNVFMQIFRDALLNNAQVTNVPRAPWDVVNKAYVDTLPYVVGPTLMPTVVGRVPVFDNTTGNALRMTPVSIDPTGTITGVNNLVTSGQAEFQTINMGAGKHITIVDDPTDPLWAANKHYVDTKIASGAVFKVGPSNAQSLVRWVSTTGEIDQSPVPAYLSDTGILTAQVFDSGTVVRLGGTDYLATGGSGGTLADPAVLLIGPTQYNGGALPTNCLFIGARVGKQVVGTPAMTAATANNVMIGNDIISDPLSTSQVSSANNVVIGQHSGQYIKALQDSVIIGHQAGNSTVACEDCVFVGAGAGLTSTGGGNTGKACVFVGRLAGADNSYGRDNICIGYNTSTANFSNTIVLGSDGIAITDNSLCIAPTITSIWTPGLSPLTTTSASDNLTFDPVTGRVGHDSRYYIVAGPTFSFDPSIATLQIPGLGQGSGASLVFDTSSKLVSFVASSRRYKHDIAPIAPEYSRRIYDLVPSSFAWNKDNSPDFGLIAEDTHKTFPELVVMNEHNEPETIAYNKLPVLLLAEMKVLKGECNELRYTNEELRIENEELRSGNEELLIANESLEMANRQLHGRVDGLVEVINDQADRIDDLIRVVNQQTVEAGILRDSVDDIRAALVEQSTITARQAAIIDHQSRTLSTLIEKLGNVSRLV